MSTDKMKIALSSILKLFILCLVWFFLPQENTGINYLYTFFFEPLVIYIPLFLISVGVSVNCISKFLSENRIKILFKKLSIVIIIVSICFSVGMLTYISVSTKKEENWKNNIAKSQKYQVEHFASTPELVPDTEICADGSKYLALHNTFVYYTNQSYVDMANSKFRLDLTAYEFENISVANCQKSKKYLISEYFDRQFKYLGIDEKKINGNMNGKNYTYTIHSNPDIARSYSYFVIIIEDDSNHSLSMLALECYYVDNYSIDIPKIIEVMCTTE